MNTLPETVSEILPPNPIRVETALSRYPVHRLAKKGDITIDIRRTDEHGEELISWEVTYNSKYKQPGPLAYKLDTLIINRRIEEAPRPIPNVIRIGTLNEICRELESAESGKNTNRIKNAMYQNAYAAITAKIRYRARDGRERLAEIGDTRYGVVFTGEELPDGRRADAVYIVLHPFYKKILDETITRPLDYDYIKSLNPASQRFYELLSYQMYATIKNDRPRAKLVYSELCTYSPLTRHFDWEHARSQLAKIHAPHKKSGYIARIDFQDTTDSEGKLDWIMLYLPGPKARAEFRVFSKRGGPVILEVEPIPANPPTPAAGAVQAIAAPQHPTLPLADPELSPQETVLIGYRITDTMARQLVADYGEAKIRLQIEILEWYKATKPGKIDDEAAWLVSAIKSRNGRVAPKGFGTCADRERQAEAARQRQQAEEEKRRRERQQDAREQAEKSAILDYWASLTPSQQAELQARADAQADPESLRDDHAAAGLRLYQEPESRLTAFL